LEKTPVFKGRLITMTEETDIEPVIEEESIVKDGLKKLKGSFGNIFRVEALLLIFAIIMALVTFGETLYGSFMALFLRDFGIPVVEIGAFFFLWSATNALVSIPAGYMSDRIGRNIITIALLALAAVVFSYTLAETKTQLLLLRAAHGAVMGFIFPIARAYVMDKTTAENRGQAMGTFTLLVSLTSMVSPFIGGILRDQTGSFVLLFYIGSIIPVFAAIFFLTRIKELGTGFTIQKMKLPTKDLLRNKIFLTLLLMFGMLYFASGIMTPILSIFAVEELGMSYSLLGLLFSLMGPFYAISQFVAASASDIYGRKNLLVYPLLIYALAVGVAGFSTHYWMLFFTYMFVAIGASPYATVAYSLIGDKIAKEKRGTASGAVVSVSAIGSMVGPLVGSAIGGLTSLRVPFFVCSGVVVATIVMLFFVLPQDSEDDEVNP
jgi:MFS family permease